MTSSPTRNAPAARGTHSDRTPHAAQPVTVTFSELSLISPILEALRADGYERPTPIQAQAIPPALARRDVLGIAQTGTGKTAAFALPIIQRLVSELRPGMKLPVGRKPKALILAPTRELAAQISESFASYGRHTPVRFAVIFGGVGQGPQVRAIQQGIDILVATPGRLIDLLQQKLVSLAEIEFFVLDEADRMLDMGFIEPIRKISAQVPRERQTMLFSATMPKEIRHLADALLRDPVTVTVTPVSSAVDRIDQKLYFVLKTQKTQLLIHLFDEMQMERAVVFTKTKHGADRLARKLKAAGIQSEAIHGNKAQNQRIRALDAFRSGRSPVLVATDVAARGLDIDDVTHVVNYDLPMEPEAYVHRIGRTARAGKSGHAVSFCDTEERDQLRQVEKLIKFEIPRERVPDSVPKSDAVAAVSGSPARSATEAPRGEQRPSRDNREARHDANHSQREGHKPQREGHKPQREGHKPQREGHKPQREGHKPQREGHNQQREGHNQQREGHNQQREGHNQQREGRNPQREGHKHQHPAQREQRSSGPREGESGSPSAPQQRRLGGGFAKSPVRRRGM